MKMMHANLRISWTAVRRKPHLRSPARSPHTWDQPIRYFMLVPTSPFISSQTAQEKYQHPQEVNPGQCKSACGAPCEGLNEVCEVIDMSTDAPPTAD